MSRWTHSICAPCWWKREGTADRPLMTKGAPSKCCYCGGEHRSGIYVREDPATAPCKGEHKDV